MGILGGVGAFGGVASASIPAEWNDYGWLGVIALILAFSVLIILLMWFFMTLEPIEIDEGD